MSRALMIVLVALLAVLLLLAGAAAWSTRMPGPRLTGPLPPASDLEREVALRLRGHVNALAGEIGERNVAHPAALLAAERYLAEALASLGYEPLRQGYPAGGHKVANLEGERPGNQRPEEIVIVGAHYDSAPGAPGADDNASGAAAVLELARLLQDDPLGRTVRFVFFVNEEPPYFATEEMGSLRYARRSRERGEAIAAMLSVESVGYYADAPGTQRYPAPLGALYPSSGNFIAFVGNLRGRALVRRATETFRRGGRLPAEGGALPGGLPGIGWSDQWAFWETGYPALMVTDTALFRYPAYHTSGDTPDQIDYDRLARTTMGLAEVVRDLAAR